MKVGEKRRYAVQLNSDVPLSLALLALRFDPKVVKVNATDGGQYPADVRRNGAAIYTFDRSHFRHLHDLDLSLNGKASFKGSGPLLFIDVEAIGEGNAVAGFC